MTLTDTVKSLVRKPVLYLTTLATLITVPAIPGCYTATTPVYRNDTPNNTNIQQVQQNEYQDDNRSFIGTPLMLTHKDGDLEFLMKSDDEQANKSFYITVHEDADFSNQENLDIVKGWIEESKNEPGVEFKVQGVYNPDRIKQFTEEGTLDPYVIIKMTGDDANGVFEEVVWTDKKDSPIYTDVDLDIVLNDVYYPGHHIWLTHYPFGFNPYWDIDGDGIPNQWDPWPTLYGPWADDNHNHVWDWYDPFYEVPYWTHWHNHYGHHDGFMFEWQHYYGNDFNHHDKFKDRDRERERIRNNLGGRNPGDKGPIRNPRDKDPIIKRDPTKERDPIKDRTPIKERDSIKDRNPIKDKDPIIRDKGNDKTIEDKIIKEREKQTDRKKDQYTPPPKYKESEEKIKKEREQLDKDRFLPIKRDDTKRQDVEKKTYENPKEVKTYQPPKREERTYTPPKENTQNPRREQVTTPRPRNNTNGQQKTRDKK